MVSLMKRERSLNWHGLLSHLTKSVALLYVMAYQTWLPIFNWC